MCGSHLLIEMNKWLLTAVLCLQLHGDSCSEPVRAAVTPSGSTSSVTVKTRKRPSRRKKKKPMPLIVCADSLADPAPPGGCSVSTRLSGVPEPGAADGTCSLRAAIETANGVSGSDQRVVVVLRAGRYRPASRLPDVTGNVELRGADGPLPSPSKAMQKKATAEALDYHDRDFRPGGAMLAPVGTTIDGGGSLQILRTSYGSRLRVQSVRLENGRATDETDDDLRAALGGAICALGNVTINNSVLSANRAINGGALYVEGILSVRHSRLTDNLADRCGGVVYMAGRASISDCDLTRNSCGHFECKKEVDKQDIGKRGKYGKHGKPLPSWRKRPAASGSFDDDDDDNDFGGDAPAGPADASGAVAEGPPLYTKMNATTDGDETGEDEDAMSYSV